MSIARAELLFQSSASKLRIVRSVLMISWANRYAEASRSDNRLVMLIVIERRTDPAPCRKSHDTPVAIICHFFAVDIERNLFLYFLNS